MSMVKARYKHVRVVKDIFELLSNNVTRLLEQKHVAKYSLARVCMVSFHIVADTQCNVKFSVLRGDWK